MLAKISTGMYIIAAVLFFSDHQITLFILSIILGFFTLGLNIYVSYFRVSPQLKAYRETVYQMEEDGDSEEEILGFMNQNKEVDKSKMIDPPAWMNSIGLIGIVASFVLLVMGIIAKI